MLIYIRFEQVKAVYSLYSDRLKLSQLGIVCRGLCRVGMGCGVHWGGVGWGRVGVGGLSAGCCAQYKVTN